MPGRWGASLSLALLALVCACPRPASPVAPGPQPRTGVVAVARAAFDPLRLVPAEVLAVARVDTQAIFAHPHLQARPELEGVVERFRRLVGLDPALLSDARVFYLPPRRDGVLRGGVGLWRAAMIVPGDFEGSPGLDETRDARTYHGHLIARIGTRALIAKVPGAIVVGDAATVRAALDAFDGRAPALSAASRLAKLLARDAAGVFSFALYWPVLARYVDRTLDPGLARALVATVTLEPLFVVVSAHVETPEPVRFQAWARALAVRLSRERDFVTRLLAPLLKGLIIGVEGEAASIRWHLPIEPVLRLLPLFLRATGL